MAPLSPDAPASQSSESPTSAAPPAIVAGGGVVRPFPYVPRAADDEVDALIAAGDIRLITLHGRSGSGRTTIATRALARFDGPTAAGDAPELRIDQADPLPGLAAADVFLRAHTGGLVHVRDGATISPLTAAALRRGALIWDVTVITAVDPARRPPRQVREMWSGLQSRVLVPAFDERQTELFLAAALPGVVHPAVARELQAVTAGSPRRVRDTLEEALTTGALVRRHGVWVAPDGIGLARASRAELAVEEAELTPAQRRALLAVDLAGGLEPATLDALADPEAVAGLELRERILLDGGRYLATPSLERTAAGRADGRGGAERRADAAAVLAAAPPRATTRSASGAAGCCSPPARPGTSTTCSSRRRPPSIAPISTRASCSPRRPAPPGRGCRRTSWRHVR